MRRIFPVLCAVALAAASAGCAARNGRTYRLVNGTLVPPGVARPDIARRTVTAEVALDRGCGASARDGMELRRRGNGVRVTVSREALAGRPAGWLAEWAAGLESEGCIAPAEGFRLAARIAESMPLNGSAAFRLQRADSRQSSFVELGPGDRLQVDSPILREGAPADAALVESAKITGLTVEVKASANLAGYETAWYAVRRNPKGRGLAIVPLYADSHVQGAVERRPEPRVNYFRFGSDAAFYRMFYRGDRTILFVSAPTRSELDRRTHALKEDAGACPGFAPPACVTIPRNAGANVMTAAFVNGREVAVPLGATVGTAIRAAGESRPESVLPRLAVRKLYAGALVPVEFDSRSADILSLVLLGGEEISWR